MFSLLFCNTFLKLLLSFLCVCFRLNLPQICCPQWGDLCPVLQACGVQPVALSSWGWRALPRVLWFSLPLQPHHQACLPSSCDWQIYPGAYLTARWSVCTSLQSYYFYTAFVFYALFTSTSKSLVLPFVLEEDADPPLYTDKASLGLKHGYTLTFVVCIWKNWSITFGVIVVCLKTANLVGGCTKLCSWLLAWTQLLLDIRGYFPATGYS